MLLLARAPLASAAQPGEASSSLLRHRPAGRIFRQLWQRLGPGWWSGCAFRDHHRYTAADIDRLADAAAGVCGCDAFVITAKDEVKLDAAMRSRLNTVAPLAYGGAYGRTRRRDRRSSTYMRKSLIVTAR